jgi:hypothetical protein
MYKTNKLNRIHKINKVNKVNKTNKIYKIKNVKQTKKLLNGGRILSKIRKVLGIKNGNKTGNKYLLKYNEKSKIFTKDFFTVNGKQQITVPPENVLNVIYELFEFSTKINKIINVKISPCKFYWALMILQICEPQYTKGRDRDMFNKLYEYIMDTINTTMGISPFINKKRNIINFLQTLDDKKFDKLTEDNITIVNDKYYKEQSTVENLYLKLQIALFNPALQNSLLLKSFYESYISNNLRLIISKAEENRFACLEILSINPFNETYHQEKMKKSGK